MKDNQIKLGDLGEAKNHISSIIKTIRGTIRYWSPEMVRFEELPGIEITTKTDVWFDKFKNFIFKNFMIFLFK